MTENEISHSVVPVNIEDEMRQSYMDYAMSVIVGRALPDIRDGLKPVHRRVLYAMNEMGNDWNKSYKKSARIVGDVIGKYHPHGDSAVYETIVRMAQPFSLRHPLIDGQGNFGSIDGDAPAAMRYTEIRMARIAHELLQDLDKETVEFIPNYDGSEKEPAVLPALIPNLLVNGSSGIAVGMATNIPPHNLSEVIAAIIVLIDNPQATIIDLMRCVPGPDFPTAGIINGTQGIVDAYNSGRGKIYTRARTCIEDGDDDYQRIVVTELPYQVNKARLVEKIAELVKNKKITGIKELRDESDKDGMRVVIELRKGEVAEVLLNNLYQHTRMQNVFGINIVALDNGQPRLLNLKQLLQAFIHHRQEIITRRTRYELKKSRARMHILEGLAVALSNIDDIVELIKKSPSPAEAKQALTQSSWEPMLVVGMLKCIDSGLLGPADPGQGLGLVDGSYKLSMVQAQAILDLKLQRLTGLEQEKIIKEYNGIIEIVGDLLDILSRRERLMSLMKSELEDIRNRYGEQRLTEISKDRLDLNAEDLITEEDMVVTFSHAGYVKSQPVDAYRSQRRGGRGKSATNMKEEDFIDKLFIGNTHDNLLCFSSIGKLYWLKIYQLPQASRIARGKPIINLLELDKFERVNAVLAIREFAYDKFVFMATADGTVKKCKLTDFSRPRNSGLRAVKLAENDQLIGVDLTAGDHDVMLFSDAGKCVRFHEKEVRSFGRLARGIRGIRLGANQRVNSLIVVKPGSNASILTVTENGYGKRTSIKDYAARHRGIKGVISIKTNERNGKVVGAVVVDEGDEVMLISDRGTLIRTPVKDISVLGRNTQGVRLVKFEKGERLVSLERVAEYTEEDAGDLDVSKSADEV